MWSTLRVRRSDGASIRSAWRSATESAPPETATKTRSPPANIAWRRMVAKAAATSGVTRSAALQADPHLAVLEVLLLPHRHDLLQRVDGVRARVEGFASMGRRHGDDDARLSDLQPAHPVLHGHPLHRRPARSQPLADLPHLGLGHGGE